jgi:hypothetical protein
MPSGFQQDTNQLQAEMYRATITMSNTTYYPTADGDDNGGVTPNASDSFATLPTTLVLGKARARGNMRFRNIVNRLTGLGDCQIRDITITEANGSAQATTFSFTVAYERPGFIPLTGTAIDGSTAITTIPIALKNAIAQGIRDTTSALVRVYDPTTGVGDTQQTIAVTTTGATASQTYGTVAVTIIDESTLFD